MKILITGGGGFIGSNLVWELTRQDNPLTVIDRSHVPPSYLSDFRGDWLGLDVTEPFDLMGPFDIVFHQASLTDPRFENDQVMYQSNIRGFENILRHCLKWHSRLIYASTAGVYGNGAIPMREDQQKEILTTYGRSKLRMDEMAQSVWDKIPIVGLRYFNVFGPHEGQKGRPASMIYHLSQQMMNGQSPRLFKYGEHRRDFIYVKDVVRANLCALEAPSGIYNVGTGVGTSFNELVQLLNDVLGTNHAIEYFDMPFASETYQHHTVADTERAKSQLKFLAQWNLSEAIKDYLAYL